ncbi:MAG: endonuclease VIII [Dehalococcoidia bacterium]
MIELPEAVNIALQLHDTVTGKRIAGVTVAHTPHKLAWYYGEPPTYPGLLVGRSVGKAVPLGSMVEIEVGDTRLLLGEGVAIRFHDAGKPRPARHQLLLEFDDSTALSASVRMYGGLGVFPDGELDNRYYRVAGEKPPPLSPEFDKAYFDRIVGDDAAQKLSLKGLLATEQRIPGLGNGILQDILFNAGMHPRKKVNTLGVEDREMLFDSVKTTISRMAVQGGRDTELDLFGEPGGYSTILSRKTAGKPCPSCGTLIKKEAYMGGSVYYCGQCQSM